MAGMVGAWLFVGWVWLFVGAQESGAADVVAPLENISNQVNGCLIFLNNSPYCAISHFFLCITYMQR